MMNARDFEALVHLYLPGTEVHVVTKNCHDPTAEALAAVVRFDFGDEAWVSDLHGLQEALNLRYSGARLQVKAGMVRHPDCPEDEYNWVVGTLVVTISWPHSP